MHARYSILLFIAFTLSSSVQAGWRICGGGQTFSLNVTEVEISPTPIKAGSTTHFNIIGYQNEETYSGTLKASVKYFGVKVFEKTGNLCDNEGGPVSCPLLPGEASLDLEETMPGFLPPGKMVLTLQASRNDSMPVFCVDIDLNGNEDSASDKTAFSFASLLNGINPLSASTGNAASY